MREELKDEVDEAVFGLTREVPAEVLALEANAPAGVRVRKPAALFDEINFSHAMSSEAVLSMAATQRRADSRESMQTISSAGALISAGNSADSKFGKLQAVSGAQGSFYARRSQDVGGSKYYNSSSGGLFAKRRPTPAKKVMEIKTRESPEQEDEEEDNAQATPRFDPSYAPTAAHKSADWKGGIK